MRGYDRDEYGQSVEYDDYEDEGEGYEEEEEGDEYEEEAEEDPKPTKEALEYLGLRQRLKEQFRKQMKKEGASSLAKSSDKKKKLPYDNYGSFFGPSQPVIAERVIQESKSLLETQHLASRVASSLHPNKKSSGSTSVGSGSKSVAYDQKPKVINEAKNKVQKLKDTRDYSFLYSDDAEPSAPAKDRPPRNVSVPNSEVRSSQISTKNKPPLANNGRHAHGSRDERKPVSMNGGRDERKPVSMNGQMHSKMVPNSSASRRPESRSMDSRKELGRNSGNGPGRPLGPKGLPSKMPPSTTERKASGPGVKSSMSGVQRPLPSKLQSTIPKQHLQQRKEVREPNKLKVLPKQSAGVSRPQTNKPQVQRKISSQPMSQEYRPKKKPVRRRPDDEYDDEGVDYSSMIRNMFGYHPDRFAGDDDDSDMEANFEDIMMEERRSAKIARQEDEEQARLIEEEERQERLRRAKKRKLAR